MLANRRVVCSVSGGKDSTATSLFLSSIGVEHDRVFIDVGWEHESTVGFVTNTLAKHIGPIDVIHPVRDMVGEIRQTGIFPNMFRRWCTERLKIRTVRAHFKKLGGDIVNAVGVRAEESPYRAKLRTWERDREYLEIWRPILHWPIEAVFEIHRDHGVPLNPLYAMGFGRVGCWPCIFSNRGNLLRLAELDPARVGLIRELEAELSARHGQTCAWYRDGRGKPLPIDAAIELSRATLSDLPPDHDWECAGDGSCVDPEDRGDSDA